jgi:Xaa-Pro aminopeptidase
MTGDTLQALEEKSGAHFDTAMLLEARRHARAVVETVAAAVVPGMLEDEALALTKQVMKDGGMVRGWHGTMVRFGENTLKDYGEPSVPGVRLGENDLFFLDIGPVWQKYEGDYGDTFAVGNDPDMVRIASDVRVIFDATADAWRQRRLSGRDLYALAGVEAERRGWELNLKLAGHRLSDFPHAVHHKGALIAADYAPSPGLWVLEIQIRHPTRPFSAFYEDLLLA